MGDLRENESVPFEEDGALDADGSAGSDATLDTERSAAPSAPTPAAPRLPEHLRSVHEASIEESRRLAARFIALAPSFHDADAQDFDEDAADAELLSVGLALRCTRTVADRIVRDSHVAVTQLPRTLLRLDSGEFPAAWFDRILRRTRYLTARQMAHVDAAASRWPVTLTTEQFHLRLSRLLSHLDSQQETPAHLTPRGAPARGAAAHPG